ncbi:MAG: hypothetical protein AB1428_14670 [Bacteroidota bacterium]
MRTLTITAMMAALVALPLILRKRRARLQTIAVESGVRPPDDPRRYDLFDFMF